MSGLLPDGCTSISEALWRAIDYTDQRWPNDHERLVTHAKRRYDKRGNDLAELKKIADAWWQKSVAIKLKRDDLEIRLKEAKRLLRELIEPERAGWGDEPFIECLYCGIRDYDRLADGLNKHWDVCPIAQARAFLGGDDASNKGLAAISTDEDTPQSP